jgi:hypothetical protein
VDADIFEDKNVDDENVVENVDDEGILPSLDFSIPTELFSQYIDANFPSW